MGQQSLPGGGLQMMWTGQLTQGNGPPQPISGQIFAKQRDTDVFLLMVAATEDQADQVEDAIAILGSTLNRTLNPPKSPRHPTPNTRYLTPDT